MYSIYDRVVLELESLSCKETLKEKRGGKRDFHYIMEAVFVPVTEKQKQNQTKP